MKMPVFQLTSGIRAFFIPPLQLFAPHDTLINILHKYTLQKIEKR